MEKEALFRMADEIRKKHCGDSVYIRAIIEFSNYCRCNCRYCGIRNANHAVTRYRMTLDEILSQTEKVAEAGYRTVILQSGEDPFYTKEKVGALLRAIKQNCNLTITLSLGERSREEYAYFRECGADRYLIKHETCDEVLYNQLHPQSSFQERRRCQNDLYELGYELGSGFMVGLPGQTEEQLFQEVQYLKELHVAMAGISPYVCHPQTPLFPSPDGTAERTLQAVARTRILLPTVLLPSTTALNIKGGMQDALQCGANVIMQKATPFPYRDWYDIYPGRESVDVDLGEQRKKLIEQLDKIGRIGI